MINISFIKNKLNLSEGSRSEKAKKNIFLLFVFQGFNFISTILLVPLTLNYLGKFEYGVWLTLSSVISWLGYLDFGIGNGLRNKLAAAITQNDKAKAKVYVSTAYAIFGIASIALTVLFLSCTYFINWNSVLKVPQGSGINIKFLVIFVFIFFVIQFLLKLIYSITAAVQKPGINGFLTFTANLITVIYVYLLTKTSSGSLNALGIGSAVIPALIYFLSSIYLFNKQFKDFSPSFSDINFEHSRDLFALGIKFFVIQLSGLVVFSTDNLIITQLFNPAEVTVYNISYKYFILSNIAFNLILSPFWSAYTEAYIKKDFSWIKKTTNNLIMIWGAFSVAIIIMMLISNLVYKVWVGSEILVPFHLSVLMGTFTILNNWNNIYTYFINGTGKIKLQFYYAIFLIIINIPVSIFFAKYLNLGAAGVMAGTCFCLLIGAIWSPVQYLKIIRQTDKGIWSK